MCRKSSSRPRENAAFFFCKNHSLARHAVSIPASGFYVGRKSMVAAKMLAGKNLAEQMFADSMLNSSWAQRSRRSWTTLTSFALQAAVGGLLLLLPMLKTVGLPAYRALSTPVSFGRLAPEPLPTQSSRGGPAVSSLDPAVIHLLQPPRIPTSLASPSDDAPPQLPGGPGGGGYTGSRDGIPDVLASTTESVLPAPPKPAPATITRAIRTSSMLQGNLIRRVEPVYPALARSARIEGAVEVAAVISKTGTIENLRVLSGHPLLVRAAIEAVSQWRYRPYILNGEPVEVETQITVRFFLSGK
jgi:protein TonB